MKRALTSAILVIASLVVSLPAGELALRAAGFYFPSLYVPDPVTGSRLRAGMEGQITLEGDVYVRINSRGLRDREHPLPKPADVYRLAVLGDSYAEALQVELEEAFWWRLAERLQACGFAPGKRVEAVNFGVSGYGTAQQLLTLRHRVGEYSPDMVLLALFAGNDIRNNSKTLEPEKLRPFYALREGGLQLDDSFGRDARFVEARRLARRRAWLQHARLYQLLRRLRAGRRHVHHNAPLGVAIAGANPSGTMRVNVRTLSERGLDENVFREPVDPQWREAWTVTEKLLIAVQHEARSRGARYVVAVIPSAGAVYPDAALRARYAAALGADDLLYVERRLAAFGAAHGIEVVPLAPGMQRHADAQRVFLYGFPATVPGFGHWNPAGHALAARLLAGRLCPGGRS